MSWVSRLGAVVDDALLGAVTHRFSRRKAPNHSATPDLRAPHDRRALLLELTAAYAGLDLFPVPARTPRILAEERRGALPGGGTIVDVKWASGWEPVWSRARDEYLSFEPNRFAYARLYLQPSTAPSIVCVHGYGGGHFAVEERAFPARWLYKIGLNVALPVLPFHGRRKAEGAVWPSVNVARTNEGFGQTVWDLRALRAILAARGGGEFAMAGMSLGGYSSSLFATVDEVALVVPMIPVASFPDLFWDHGERSETRQRAERDGVTLPMLRDAMRAHTPLDRTPRVTGRRALVISADGDRIAPPDHGTRLARHFACEELRLPGGHLLQTWRGEGFRTLGRRLTELGLTHR